MSIKPLIYRSTDAGAPQLTGQAGSLVSVLDAVLVNGYGVGVDAKAPAGWTLEFSGTNKRVYRNSVTHGTGTYLRVDDTGSEQLAEPRIAWLRAYEVMNSIDSGMNPAPTVAQLGFGCSIIKSTLASAVSRAWTIFACCRYAYIFIDAAGDSTAEWSGAGLSPGFIGDCESPKPDDEFCFVVAADIKQSYSNGSYGGCFSGVIVTGEPSPSAGCMFVMRDHSGVAGAARVYSAVQRFRTTATCWGNAGAVFPAIATGGALLEEGVLSFGNMTVAGKMPGLLVPLHAFPFPDMAVTNFLGKRYVAKRYVQAYVPASSAPGSRGQVVIEAYEHE